MPVSCAVAVVWKVASQVAQATGTILVATLSTSTVCLCGWANVLHFTCGKWWEPAQRERDLLRVDHGEVDWIANSVRIVKNGYDLGSGSVKFDGEILELQFLPHGQNMVALGGMRVRHREHIVELIPDHQVIEQLILQFPNPSEAQQWMDHFSKAANAVAANDHHRLHELQRYIRKQQVLIDALSKRAHKVTKLEEMYTSLQLKMKKMEKQEKERQEKQKRARRRNSAPTVADLPLLENLRPLTELQKPALTKVEKQEEPLANATPRKWEKSEQAIASLIADANADFKKLGRQEQVIVSPRSPRRLEKQEPAIASPRTLKKPEPVIVSLRGLEKQEQPLASPRSPRRLEKQAPAIASPRRLEKQEPVMTSLRGLEKQEPPMASPMVSPRPDLDEKYASVEAKVDSLAQGLEKLEKRTSLMPKVPQITDFLPKKGSADNNDEISPTSERVRTQLNGRVTSLMQRLEMLERHAEMGLVAQRVSQLEKIAASGLADDAGWPRYSPQASYTPEVSARGLISNAAGTVSYVDDNVGTAFSSQASSMVAPTTNLVSQTSSLVAPTTVIDGKGQYSSPPLSPRTLEIRARQLPGQPTGQPNAWMPRLEISERQISGQSSSWTPRLEMSDKLAVAGSVAQRVDELEKRSPVSGGRSSFVDSYGWTQGSSSRSGSPPPVRELLNNQTPQQTNLFMQTPQGYLAEGAMAQRMDKLEKRADGFDDRGLSPSFSQPNFSTTAESSKSWVTRRSDPLTPNLTPRPDMPKRFVAEGAVADRIDKLEKPAFPNGLSQSQSQPSLSSNSDINKNRLHLRSVLKQRLQIFESPPGSVAEGTSSPEDGKSRLAQNPNSLAAQIWGMDKSLSSERAVEELERGRSSVTNEKALTRSASKSLTPVRERSRSDERETGDPEANEEQNSEVPDSGRRSISKNSQTHNLRQRLELFERSLSTNLHGDQALSQSPSQPSSMFATVDTRISQLSGRGIAFTQSTERLDRSAVAQRVDDLVSPAWTPLTSPPTSVMPTPEMKEKREIRGAEAVRMWRRRYDPETNAEQGAI